MLDFFKLLCVGVQKIDFSHFYVHRQDSKKFVVSGSKKAETFSRKLSAYFPAANHPHYFITILGPPYFVNLHISLLRKDEPHG